MIERVGVSRTTERGVCGREVRCGGQRQDGVGVGRGLVCERKLCAGRVGGRTDLCLVKVGGA